MANIKYKVIFTEYERGWGQRDEVSYYDSYDEAMKEVQACNSDNTETIVPDWYMTARFVGVVDLDIPN